METIGRKQYRAWMAEFYTALKITEGEQQIQFPRVVLDQAWRLDRVAHNDLSWWWFVSVYYLVWCADRWLIPIEIYTCAIRIMKDKVKAETGKDYWEIVPELLQDYRRIEK